MTRKGHSIFDSKTNQILICFQFFIWIWNSLLKFELVFRFSFQEWKSKNGCNFFHKISEFFAINPQKIPLHYTKTAKIGIKIIIRFLFWKWMKFWKKIIFHFSITKWKLKNKYIFLILFFNFKLKLNCNNFWNSSS